VNWFLFISVILMLFIFQESAKLAAAYGLSVAGAMSITGVLMSMIFFYQRAYMKMSVSIVAAVVSLLFFISCWLKIPHGGYWSLIIASIPLFIVLLYTQGQKRLYKALIPVDKDSFLREYEHTYETSSHIEGTALFFARKSGEIPAYIAKTMFKNGIVYERNIIITIITSNEPHGISSTLMPLSEGMELLTIKPGYMENLNVETILREKNIFERTIFYGDEEIISHSFLWKVFAFIKDVSPNFVSFYQFPQEKLIGVSRRVEL
jgi:KUP system potassium uptake protein